MLRNPKRVSLHEPGVRNAVSQIMGHRILEKHSSLVAPDFVSQKFGTQNNEANNLECETRVPRYGC